MKRHITITHKVIKGISPLFIGCIKKVNGGFIMSKWMISHASAYIISPTLASLLIGIATGIYYGSFVEFGFGVAIISYMFYMFFLIGVGVMLVLFFIRKKESTQSNLFILVVLSVLGGLIYQTGMYAVMVTIYYTVASIIYVLIQLSISKMLVSRFKIHDEFLNEDNM